MGSLPSRARGKTQDGRWGAEGTIKALQEARSQTAPR